MPFLFQSYITRRDLQVNRKALYIFGDNLERRGRGGQAAEMRGEPNAIGLPTKRSPSQYLIDTDLPEIERENEEPLLLIHQHLFKKHGAVIWPLKGIGTGLAELYNHAPAIMQYYARVQQTLELGA